MKNKKTFYKVMKGISAPFRGKWRPKVKDLKVGDCILVPHSDYKGIRYALKGMKFSYVSKKDSAGVTFWRVK